VPKGLPSPGAGWPRAWGFAALTIVASILLSRRLTHSSWPLDHVEPWLAAAAALAYLGSFFFRARAWHRLFPADECPGQSRCLASVGAAAASGAVLPFRLDYLIKVGVLRKLGGIRVGLGAIALSIVSLGMIDAIAMLPLSVSATVTTSPVLRGPLLVVVAFGIGCSTLLVVGRRLASVRLLGRSRSVVAAEPLVLAIDDLQWRDASSAKALTFVVRRSGVAISRHPRSRASDTEVTILVTISQSPLEMLDPGVTICLPPMP